MSMSTWLSILFYTWSEHAIAVATIKISVHGTFCQYAKPREKKNRIIDGIIPHESFPLVFVSNVTNLRGSQKISEYERR